MRECAPAETGEYETLHEFHASPQEYERGDRAQARVSVGRPFPEKAQNGPERCQGNAQERVAPQCPTACPVDIGREPLQGEVVEDAACDEQMQRGLCRGFVPHVDPKRDERYPCKVVQVGGGKGEEQQDTAD